MTNEEAVRQLNNLDFKLYKLHYGDIELFNEYPEYGYDFDSALSLAIEALKKRIPKKPFPCEYEGHRGKVCPECQEDVWRHNKFCYHCGQRIDWGDEE